MAPVAVTDDYYGVLGVAQTATSAMITQSYKRLALLLHPDKNKDNSTAAFQQLGNAYETLKDENKRRAYDLIYPKIEKIQRPSTPQQPHAGPDATKSQQDDVDGDVAAIFTLLKGKHERAVGWLKLEKVYNDAILKIKRDIPKLHNAIRELEEIEKTEQAEDAAKEAAAKSWKIWLLSPIYKKPVETEEEKFRRQGDRLQRLHSKNFKEKGLKKKESELRVLEEHLKTKQQEFNIEDMKDEASKSILEERIRAGRKRLQQEKGGGKIETKAKETCDHAGWWDKVEGLLNCEKCLELYYSWLLQCPSCKMKACACCKHRLRPLCRDWS